MRTWIRCVIVLMICAGCSKPATSETAAPAQPPAKLSGAAVKEADLGKITLSAEAEGRLGIRVEDAKVGAGTAVRRYAGEVIEPAGSRIVVSSSVAGTLHAVSGAPPAVGAVVKKDQPVFDITPFIPLPRDLRVRA